MISQAATTPPRPQPPLGGLTGTQAQQQEFNRQCNEVFRKGQQEYGGEFDDAVRSLNAVGYGNRPDALAAIAAMPEGHRVYRALASDLDDPAECDSSGHIAPVETRAAMSRATSDFPTSGSPASSVRFPIGTRPFQSHSTGRAVMPDARSITKLVTVLQIFSLHPPRSPIGALPSSQESKPQFHNCQFRNPPSPLSFPPS